MVDAIRMVEDSLLNKLSALEQMGATSEQVDATFDKLMSNEVFDGQRWASFKDYAYDMEQLNQEIDNQVESFQNARNSAIEHTKALSGTSVSMNDVAEAELALNNATQANIEGLIRMDSQTLSGLQNAIDTAKAKMDNLAQSAKNTADSLEANLARIKGDDTKAREIEQTKKLTALEEKLNQARQRGNTEEIKELERALNLQKQINSEENKRAKESKHKQRSTPNRPITQTTPSSNNSNNINSNNSIDIDVNSLADVIDDNMIKTLKNQGAKELMNSLMQEMKRRAS